MLWGPSYLTKGPSETILYCLLLWSPLSIPLLDVLYAENEFVWQSQSNQKRL